MSYVPNDVITVELFWKDTLPKIEVPPQRHIRNWLFHYTLDQIFAAIELEKNSRDYADRIGRRVSSTLRRRHGDSQAVVKHEITCALHFDESGARV